MKYPRTNKNPFHPVLATYSAFTIVEALARDAHLQRVCVINDNRQVVNIVTQSDVLDYVNKRHTLITEGKKAKTLGQCQNLIKPVVTVNEADTVFNAFATITKAQVHGAAIVKTTEAGDRISGNLSLRDMKNLGFGVEKFWRLHSMNIHNYMLHLRQETEKGARPRSWVTVKASETLLGTIQKLYEHNLHHVYILDDDKVPIGVVSIQDVLREFIASE
jgi:CBS-domain-containing membrane protein